MLVLFLGFGRTVDVALRVWGVGGFGCIVFFVVLVVIYVYVLLPLTE